MLSDKAIEEFQRLYERRFGKAIAKIDAAERGMRLIQLVKILMNRSPLRNSPHPSNQRPTSAK